MFCYIPSQSVMVLVSFAKPVLHQGPVCTVYRITFWQRNTLDIVINARSLCGFSIVHIIFLSFGICAHAFEVRSTIDFAMRYSRLNDDYIARLKIPRWSARSTELNAGGSCEANENFMRRAMVVVFIIDTLYP